jgi:hypothetical protein
MFLGSPFGIFVVQNHFFFVNSRTHLKAKAASIFKTISLFCMWSLPKINSGLLVSWVSSEVSLKCTVHSEFFCLHIRYFYIVIIVSLPLSLLSLPTTEFCSGFGRLSFRRWSGWKSHKVLSNKRGNGASKGFFST